MSRVEPIERLFLHFYDPHFFEDRKKKVVGNMSGQSPVVPEARLASRIAVLAAREVLIPAASFIEVAECRATVLELASLFEMGKIRLVGSGGPSLADYAGEKLLQYDPDGSRYPIYAAINDLPVESPPFLTRRNSATQDVVKGWRETDLATLVSQTGLAPRGLEEMWQAVPEHLGLRAFTPEYAMEALGDLVKLTGPQQTTIGIRVATRVNSTYFDSFAAEYECGTLRNLLYLDSEQLPPRDTSLNYRQVIDRLRREGLLERVKRATAEELVAMTEEVGVVRALSGGLVHPPHLLQRFLPPAPPAMVMSLPDTRQFALIRSGKSSASRFEKLIERCFVYAFPLTLADPQAQDRVDDGRKIIDITFTNMATEGGLMAWARSAYGAHKVIVECKNYSDDPANPEVDQLAGRMRPEFGKFGILVCRRAENMELLVRRCQDARRNQGLLLVPLVDEDMIKLVESVDHRRTSDAGDVLVGDASSALAARMWEVHSGG